MPTIVPGRGLVDQRLRTVDADLVDGHAKPLSDERRRMTNRASRTTSSGESVLGSRCAGGAGNQFSRFGQESRSRADKVAMSTGTAARWMGVGHSGDADALAAGRAAASKAVTDRLPALLMVYASTGYDLERLLDGVRSYAGEGTVIAGCTTLGEVVAGRADPMAGGVVVVARGRAGPRGAARVGRHVSDRRREAGAEAAESVTDLAGPHRIGLLLCDGLVGEQHEVVRGAYSVLGAPVPLVGGCAGDDLTYSADPPVPRRPGRGRDPHRRGGRRRPRLGRRGSGSASRTAGARSANRWS